MVTRWSLVSINVVTLRWARLVGDFLGRVNHVGAEPGTQVNSALAFPPWLGAVSTQLMKVVHC